MKKSPLSLKAALVGLVVFAGGATTIMVFASAIGYQLDRPVFRSEFIEIAGPSLDDLLLRKERRLWEIEASIRNVQARGHPVDRKLIDERNLLRREISELTRRVRTLR